MSTLETCLVVVLIIIATIFLFWLSTLFLSVFWSFLKFVGLFLKFIFFVFVFLIAACSALHGVISRKD
jgi:hypothetical protein